MRAVRRLEFVVEVLMFKFLAIFLATCGSAFAVDEGAYKFLREIPIGGEGGYDILTVDSPAHRLYLSHATKVVVVDLEKNAVAGEIMDTPGVHAFLPVPELGRGFSTNGKENKSSVVDLKTLRTLSRIDVGENPDAIAYEPKSAQIFVFNHGGNSASVIDAKSEKVVATIPLGGSPEFPVVDSAAGRVYVNLEDKSEIAVIDVRKHEVSARWPLAPGAEPTGLALDLAHHRLFATCNNNLLEMVDTESGKVAGSVPIGKGVDGCAFDEAGQLAFASCGEGVTVIAKETSPGSLSLVQQLKTQRGARTIALDPQTHRIYLPAADFGPPATPGGRPSIVPNTMRLLVYGPVAPTK